MRRTLLLLLPLLEMAMWETLERPIRVTMIWVRSSSRMLCVIEAVVDAVNSDDLGRGAAAAVDGDELDHREPVEAAGKPRDLAIMAERGIDEAGGAKKGAHMPAL